MGSASHVGLKVYGLVWGLQELGSPFFGQRHDSQCQDSIYERQSVEHWMG